MLTLVLGGTRSGKSSVAESLAGRDRDVTVMATASIVDDDFAARVDRHRRARPAHWTTVETAGRPRGLAGAIESTAGVILVDGLGTWLTTHPDFDAPVDSLVEALRTRADDIVVVSEEVGLSIHATTAAARRFVDALGLLNQAVAAHADRVLLVVAGRSIELPAR